jgi:hypothetical protein
MDNEPVDEIFELLSNLEPKEQIRVLRLVKAQLASEYLRKADEHTKISQEHKEYHNLLKANL